jgi:2-oxoglutarate decarboxylase
MKEAIATVSQHSHPSESLTDSHSEFGANEWLVDEMYDQYLKDKNSVDASWQRYFADHPEPSGSSAQSNGSPAPAAAKVPAATAPGQT